MSVVLRFGSPARYGPAPGRQLLVFRIQRGDEGPTACAVRESVGAVDELVDGASQRQAAYGRIGDAAGQRLGETFGVQDPERPVVKGPYVRIDWCGQPEVVVQVGDGFVGDHEVVLAVAPVACGHRGG